MLLRFVCFIFLFSVNIFATVTINFPNDGFVTSNSSIDLVFEATEDQGFLMIQNKIVPIRQVKQSVPLNLNYGENEIFIYVLDKYRKIEFDLTSVIHVYRSVAIEDSVSFSERYLITELMSKYNISLLNKGFARMDQPILKKDMYAFLMFFYLDQPSKPLIIQYSDMDVNGNYMSLYQQFPTILPEPVLNRFYPDSFVTVKDMIQLLLVLENNYQSISDGNMLSDFLDIPSQFKLIIPKNWKVF